MAERRHYRTLRQAAEADIARPVGKTALDIIGDPTDLSFEGARRQGRPASQVANGALWRGRKLRSVAQITRDRGNC